MPVVVAERDLTPQEIYDDSHPTPLKGLRARSSALFDVLRRLYAAYARAEAAIAPSTPLDPTYHMRRLAAEIPPGPGRFVLDVGGGSAPYRSVLNGERDEWIVLEKDRYHARELQTKGASADFLVGAAEAIPLQAATCDLVVLTEVLEHCNRPQEVLSEIARVLKPGGFCAGTAPQYWHVHGWPSDYFRYTSNGLVFLAGEAGMEVRRMEARGGPLLLLWAVVDLTTSRWSRIPGISLLVRVPSLWIASGLDRLLYRDPRKMRYPDTMGWAFLFRKPETA